jgi:maltooligosyltrehalose trehalohydrolase
MAEFKVWVPNADKVKIVIQRQPRAMRKCEDGWWYYDYPGEEQEVNYGYLIDGKGPYPDPRSPYQPDGVHGLSRTADHDLFEWTDDGWQPPPLSSAIVYELHVGTFTPEGTFEGVISKLDYLKELGVTHIELMPVNEFSGDRNWGYDGVDIYAPHHTYGGPEGLKKLVNECHHKGLGVIIDVVYNHFGPEGNYLEQFGPYLTDRYSTGWGKAVNFDDAYSNEVRRFVVDNALMWLRDYHFDGLRIDAVHAIYDQSAIHILEQLEDEVEQLQRAIGRRLFVIAESDLNNPRIVEKRDIGGYELDAQWSDDFHHALHAILTGERDGYYQDFGEIANLAKSLKSVFVYDGIYSQFRKRIHGRAVKHNDGNSFVVCIQNHDQVGNRAAGERISHLVSVGQIKIAAAIVMTSPFVPMLFQGQEWATSSPFQYFTDHHDKELAKAVTQGRRMEFSSFGWDTQDIPDPQSKETFNRSKLNFSEIDEEYHSDIYQWYRSLIELRKSLPELSGGALDEVEIDYDEREYWLKMKRKSVIVVSNFSNSYKEIPLTSVKQILLKSQDAIELTPGILRMPKHSVVILK